MVFLNGGKLFASLSKHGLNVVCSLWDEKTLTTWFPILFKSDKGSHLGKGNLVAAWVTKNGVEVVEGGHLSQVVQLHLM